MSVTEEAAILCVRCRRSKLITPDGSVGAWIFSHGVGACPRCLGDRRMVGGVVLEPNDKGFLAELGFIGVLEAKDLVNKDGSVWKSGMTLDETDLKNKQIFGLPLNKPGIEVLRDFDKQSRMNAASAPTGMEYPCPSCGTAAGVTCPSNLDKPALTKQRCHAFTISKETYG